MDVGSIIDLDITGVAHGGVFVARHEGRVVFVPDAIPGERVRARLTDTSKKSFWRAETLDVLDAAPTRRPHVWAPADIDVPPERRPGGADFGHIDLAAQRELKLDVVRDALARIGRLEVPATISSATAQRDTDGSVLAEETVDGTGWRTRLSLHVDDAGVVGPFAQRSHRVVPVESMPLATPAVERALASLGVGRPGHIDLVQAADGAVRILPRPAGERPDPAVREVVVEQAAGRSFRVDAGGFWQVHRLAAHTLTGVVARRLVESAVEGLAVDPDGWHLDLYGGVGLFAATLGDLGGGSTRVTSVESDVRATEHAGRNLAEWVGARAETARVDRWISALRASASASQRARLARGVVLLDPPRAGAGRQVVEDVAALDPRTVVYVACDPVALARDLGTFREAGYLSDRVDAFDLFPNSHHVEAVAVLRRG
ncbi:class I SAM-dependent RNA methyltransferase [Microbacterium aquimaris]|uniref:Class I SAM-dependent RNA methyltransferase n=1 Tax=Microbacterium aquimaris TaxID=459816 RepID=A0ABU5N619_9MICO|nr:class I SAM-dependent RNA methyltransferase [Microbacterium aquimaris]MDZ8161525.1 class I SAM-dependent RNA methyltransferase [Microbacterium aquimaris]